MFRVYTSFVTSLLMKCPYIGEITITIKTPARLILWLEPLILLAIVYFFWFPSNFPSDVIVEPVDRAEWLWLLGALIPVYLARFVVYGRLWTITLLDAFWVALIVLCVLSVETAPYPSRGMRMLARPLMGVVLVIYCVELTRTAQSLEPLLKTMIVLAWLAGIVALTMTQWNAKSADLRPIIDTLPRMSTFIIPGGFNPNEIAGGLAWLAPLSAGLVFYPWRKREEQRFSGWAVGAGVGFGLILLALILGQSRFAIAGVLVTLFVVGVLVVPAGIPRWLALGVLVLITLFQVNLVLNVVDFSASNDEEDSTTTGLTVRDERTFGQRFDIWRSAFDMVRDHPLTGVGMNRFRYGPVRQAYPVTGFDIPETVDATGFRPRLIPHAHNVFIQVTTDFGIPGFIVYTGWNIVIGWMLWRGWRRGNTAIRVAAISVGAGLLAHFVYGMGDAVTLWDRLIFIYWLMMGLAVAQFVLLRSMHTHDTDQRTLE